MGDGRKAAGGELGLSLLALFASSGTLVCCALPILLVTLGLGATLAGVLSHLPWLVALSQYKIWVFALAGALLLASGIVLYRPGQACPTDPALAALCNRMRRFSRTLFWSSAVLWLIGFFFAFLWLPLELWWQGTGAR